MTARTPLIIGLICLATSNPSRAQDMLTMDHNGMHHENQNHHDHTKANPAPIGIMGDHMHKAGGWMLSYRFMNMHMDGNRIGTNNISPNTIATTQANRFSGVAGQPPTLRVVPTEMDMNMHMLGAMYAPTDWLTLMAMGNYTEKDMNHITYQGGAGTTQLGTFKTQTKGWGDTSISGLVRLYQDSMHHAHLNLGISLPTGSIDKDGIVLAPTGATPRLRLPYAMQLGSGTYDALPGVTYTGQSGSWGWGAQYSARIALESENDQGYAMGDKHELNAWSSYRLAPWLSASARLNGTNHSKIDGIDPNIVVPVQTADPDNYGGRQINLGLGVNFTATKGALKGQTFAIEATAPLYRDLNGPQLETDYALTTGIQYRF